MSRNYSVYIGNSRVGPRSIPNVHQALRVLADEPQRLVEVGTARIIWTEDNRACTVARVELDGDFA